MKAILFIFTLFFSALANAAAFSTIWGGVDHPEGGYYDSYDGVVWTSGYKDPFIYHDAVDPGYVDNEFYFAIGTDLVDRSMSTGLTFAFDNPSFKPIHLVFSWKTYDVFNAGLFYDGNSINLPGTGFGTFEYMLFDNVSHFAIGGRANSLNSFLEYSFYEFQSLNEVPIPASLFLFAPILLGILITRRKVKSL